MGGWEYKAIVSYKNIDELQKKVNDHSMRVTKSECLDLPKKLYKFSNFDLTKKQLDLIEQIKRESVADIESGLGSRTILLEHVMTRLTKIQQISNGYFYDNENDKTILIVPPEKNPRLLRLKEELNQIEGKAIIWTRYKADIQMIKTIMNKDEFVVYDGSVSADERKENKKRFTEDDSCKYFIVNQQAGSRGLTLVAAEHSFYYSNSYDLELRLQSEDRNHRIGTVNNVLYTDLVANKTPDKKTINALKKKKIISDLI